MKPVCQAIKYGLDVLNISADKLKSIVEESKGYDGESNDRWVSAKIIEVAEKNGILFTQLLAKWDLYIVEIEEEILAGSGMVMSDAMTDALEELVLGNVVSFGRFDQFSREHGGIASTDTEGTETFNWRKGIDMFGSPDFAESVSEEFRKNLDDGSPVTVIAYLNGTRPIEKTSDLVSDARQAGYRLANEGQALLYRLITMHRAFPNAEIRTLLHSSQKFWSDGINRPLIREFLSTFKVDTLNSFYASAKEFDANNHREGYGVLVVADNDPRKAEVQTLELGPFSEDGKIRLFLNQNETDFEHYLSTHKGTLRVPSINNGKIDGYRNAGFEVTGENEVLGYYCRNGAITIENFPRHGAESAGFTVSELSGVVASFGLTKAFNGQGEYMNGIPRILTGQEGIENLIANCLPLFLYGAGSNIRDWGSINNEDGSPNRLDNKLAFTSEAIQLMVDKYYPFMDFEAKDFMDDMKDIEEDEGVTIAEYRHKCREDEGLDPQFMSDYNRQLEILRDHVVKNYGHFI